jgi:glycosyltransferase involved in cell wall biosynthesis
MPIKIVNKKRNLSIVHINTHDIAGGAAKVAWRLAEAQRNARHNAKMLVGSKMSGSEYSFSFPVEADPALQAQCLREGQLFYEFQGSHKLINNHIIQSADILNLHNLHGGYFNPFSISALSHFKPIVWTLHDMQSFTGHCAHSFDSEGWVTGCDNCPHLQTEPALVVDTSAQLWKDKKLIYDHSYLWIVTPSQWLKNKAEKSILQNHPIELIYNGIDTTIFRPYSKKEMRSSLGIPDDMFVIGSVAHGGISNHWKGGQFTQSVLNALWPKYNNCIFLNIGGTLPSDKRFFNTGHIEDENILAHYYSCLDIFLYTPLADNCPLTILEALACGIPIVTFDVGGIPELVRNASEGFVIANQNLHDMTQAVESLMNDSIVRKKFTENARERAVTVFDHKLISSNYENLYFKVLEQNRKIKMEAKLFVLSKVPDIIKTKDFLSSETYKEKLLRSVSSVGLKKRYPKISIVTPSFNQGQFLEECIDSILSQNYPNLEYIIMDGGSTDNSVDIIKKYEKHLTYWQSHADDGHYAAVNEGFKRTTGEIMGWLNSDDKFHPNGLFVLGDVFRELPHVKFLTGKRIGFTGSGTIHSFGFEQQTWSRKMMFDRQNIRKQLFIMQEATYWRRELWDKAGSSLNQSYAFAADFELWLRFSRFTQLHTVDALIAGFRYHGPSQRSRIHLNEYLTECEKAITVEENIASEHPRLDSVSPPLIRYPLHKESHAGIIIKKDLKISIVTPSFNQGQFLEECIDSILSQNYPNLEYIIMDGGSTDHSVAIIKKYEKYLAYWHSRPDNGQYAAVDEGLRKTTGEIMGWLNSDDILHPQSLDIISNVLSHFAGIEWIMGRPNGINEQGKQTWVLNPLPLWSREKYLKRQYKNPYIQQEGTFWRRSLWEKAGGALDTGWKLAADLDLWARFFRHAQIYSVDALLGAFRQHPGQKTAAFLNEYHREAEQIIDREIALYSQSADKTLLPAPPPISAAQIVALRGQTVTDGLSEIREEEIPGVKVSAIVSTYNAERLIRGCLEDLVNQTLYQKGELEIIVVDSGSEQNEKTVVGEFQQKHRGIHCLKTKRRETVYAAWNRGIRASSGRYITNANTDDRHRKDALEVMADVLENNPDTGLVYADVIITETENETFENHTRTGHYQWPDFDRTALSVGCFIGPQPMWRKSLHNTYGYFDESFSASGDWEFWLRIAEGTKFLHIPEYLGVYLRSPRSLEHQNAGKRIEEDRKIYRTYIPKYLPAYDRYFTGIIATDSYPVHVYRYGQILAAFGRYDDAISLYESYLKRNPAYPGFNFLIDDLKNAKVRHGAAQAPPAADLPEEIMDYINQAERHYAENDLTSAREAIKQALKYASGHPQLTALLSNMLDNLI